MLHYKIIIDMNNSLMQGRWMIKTMTFKKKSTWRKSSAHREELDFSTVLQDNIFYRILVLH